MSVSPHRDLVAEIAEMIEWWPREEPKPDLRTANDYQIQDAGIDYAQYEVAKALRPHLERFEAAATAVPAIFDLHWRVRRGEFEPKAALTPRDRTREAARLRHAFAEAIRGAYGARAVAHEHIFVQAERLAQDRRQRILGCTWASSDRPSVELSPGCHLLAWYDLLNSAACAALGFTDWPYETYPKAPEANPSHGNDESPEHPEP